MLIIAWNTGCRYTARGQRIAVTPLGNGRVVFLDRDRGIDGVTDLPEIYDWVTDQDKIKRAVHLRYLANDYQPHIYNVPNFRQVQRALIFACDQLPVMDT